MLGGTGKAMEGGDRAAGRWVGWRRYWQAGTVLVVGLLITAALTVTSALSYRHNEQRLTSLLTRLTAAVLQTAQPQLQARLGRVIGLTAGASDPAGAFRVAIAGELAPRGPFASATVAVVWAGWVRVLADVGSVPLQGLNSRATTELFLQVARTSSLVTTRVVAGGVQKLGYLLSARGPDGVYVVGASEQLSARRRITVPAGSPDANLNFALYFGPAVDPGQPFCAVAAAQVARVRVLRDDGAAWVTTTVETRCCIPTRTPR